MSSHLQWILISGIIIFFILVLLFLKRKELSLKYTLLWLLAGSVMAIMVISPSVLIVLSKLLGIETPMYIPAKSENNKVDTDNRDVGEANTRFGE